MYSKKFVTSEDLLPILIKKNLKIKNKKIFLEFLDKVNYSKIKEYLYYFDPDNKDYKGLDFDIIIDLYYFDKFLRKELLSIIEMLEIRLKNDVIKILGSKDPFSYLDHTTFFYKFDHSYFLREIEKNIKNDKNNNLIATFKKKYPNEDRLPIWIIVEIITMGNISSMYQFMKRADQISLVKLYNEKLGKDDFGSWIINLTLLRNFCAHNARVWNRNFKPIAKIEGNEAQRISGQLKVLYMLIKFFKPDFSFKYLRRELSKFFRKYPNFMKNFGINSIDDLKYLKK